MPEALAFERRMIMRLICQDCGKNQLVHSGHYWRYRRPTRCDCGRRLLPDESGLQQLKSRDESLLISDNNGNISKTARMFNRLQRHKTKLDKQALNPEP